VEGLKNFDKL